MIDHDDVRKIALSLPGAYEHASYGGHPSFRTKPRMFTWVNEDADALVVWVESEEEKYGLIESEPELFFTTEHYQGYPVVLARLSVVSPEEAAELITESWRLRAPKRAVKEWDAAHG